MTGNRTETRKKYNNSLCFGILFINSMFLLLFIVFSIQYFVSEQNVVPVSKTTILDYEGFNRHLSSYISKSDKVALILDFDGVLAPLSDAPTLTEIVPESQSNLKLLATRPSAFVAILSGRGILDVKSRVAIENITYAGNHGLEIKFANGMTYHHEIPIEIKENFTKLVNVLETKLAYNGAYVENKTLSLTFHYTKNVREEFSTIDDEVSKIVKEYGYIPTTGYYAIEASPPVHWTKGEAALLILTRIYGNDWSNQVKAIFVGDDKSDENAMKALRGKAKSFRVSPLSLIETYADYILPSTFEVSLLLEWIEKNVE